MGFILQNTNVNRFKATESLRLQLICFDEYWNYHLSYMDGNQAVLSMIEHPLLKLAITILKEKLDADDEMIRYIVDVSIILSHQDFDSMQWVNMDSINRILESSCKLNDDEINILTDFIALIRAYNGYLDTYCYYEVETTAFSDIEVEDCEDKPLVPHDSTNIAKLCELLDIKSMKLKEEIFFANKVD